jgi:universal stress protein A
MPYKHLLIAIDLSEDCHKVIDRAIELAAYSSAKLSLAHVIEPMSMAFGGDVPLDLSALQQQQVEQAQQQLDAVCARYPQLNKEDCRLIFGQPRQEIHQLAHDLGCDLVITGSHGRHGLALLLGSTANDLLHGAVCDILAVHLPKA